MEYLLIFIPITVWLIYYIFKRNIDILKCGLITTGVCLLTIIGMSTFYRYDRFSDTEFLSFYITKIKHTDEWNEYIHRTCTKQVPAGTDSKGHIIYTTITYDCSYVDYHPERWYKVDNTGNEIIISKLEFEKLRRSWNTKMRFIDLHRDYYTIDGDAQEYDWNGLIEHSDTYSMKHKYENRILGSQSVLGLEKITPEEADTIGLFDYPEILNNEQTPILSKRFPISPIDQKRLQFINGYYGKSKQFRCFLLLFDGRIGSDISEDQRAYWQGGNKNEFVICVGLSNIGEVKWANCFSWQEDQTLDLKCKQFLLEQDTFKVENLTKWIDSNIKYWNRREFKEFDYISTVITAEEITVIMWTIIILTILSILINYIIRKSDEQICFRKGKKPTRW